VTVPSPAVRVAISSAGAGRWARPDRLRPGARTGPVKERAACACEAVSRGPPVPVPVPVPGPARDWSVVAAYAQSRRPHRPPSRSRAHGSCTSQTPAEGNLYCLPTACNRFVRYRRHTAARATQLTPVRTAYSHGKVAAKEAGRSVARDLCGRARPHRAAPRAPWII